jgi:AraC-like DNA-binding protein
MVIERNDVGLDWVLFAGPITEQHRKEDVLECLHQLAARLREWLVAHPTWPRAEPSQRGGAGSLPDRASHIRRWIDVHHREHVTLDDLAAELKLSRFQTSRTIQRLTNSSWSELLGAARLRTACALLMESDLDIVDIAIRSGFSDRAHFHRTFKKKFGLSPKRWADVAHQKEA